MKNSTSISLGGDAKMMPPAKSLSAGCRGLYSSVHYTNEENYKQLGISMVCKKKQEANTRWRNQSPSSQDQVSTHQKSIPVSPTTSPSPTCFLPPARHGRSFPSHPLRSCPTAGSNLSVRDPPTRSESGKTPSQPLNEANPGPRPPGHPCHGHEPGSGLPQD